jgi:hypothetical protein
MKAIRITQNERSALAEERTLTCPSPERVG